MKIKGARSTSVAVETIQFRCDGCGAVWAPPDAETHYALEGTSGSGGLALGTAALTLSVRGYPHPPGWSETHRHSGRSDLCGGCTAALDAWLGTHKATLARDPETRAAFLAASEVSPPTAVEIAEEAQATQPAPVGERSQRRAFAAMSAVLVACWGTAMAVGNVVSPSAVGLSAALIGAIGLTAWLLRRALWPEETGGTP